MSEHHYSSPKNAFAKQPRSRVSARVSQRVRFKSGLARARDARTNDLCTPQQDVAVDTHEQRRPLQRSGRHGTVTRQSK
jgi:hypothetical protein